MSKRVLKGNQPDTITIVDDEIVPFVYHTGIVFNWINGAYRPSRGQQDDAEEMGVASRTSKYYRNRYDCVNGVLMEYADSER